jgi:S-formylglutathione hydrolase FrmB
MRFPFRNGRKAASRRGRFGRTLAAELLEPRELLTAVPAGHLGGTTPAPTPPSNLHPTVLLANRLADVTVTAAGVQVGPDNVTPDPAGQVLVINGTSGNDTISVQPSASIHGAVDVIINGKRTTYAMPIEAIVASGGKGTDTITIDSSLTIHAFLFAGSGSDKLTGGGGENVLVGGSGSDVLQGGPGSDVLIAGAAAAKLYGNTAQSAGAADGENVLLGEASTQQYNLAFLQDVIAAWAGSGTRDARVAAVNQLLGPTLQANSRHDTLYESSAADLAIPSTSKTDQVWFAVPGIQASWFSGPTRDANGFQDYAVQSNTESTQTEIRVLLPPTLQAGTSYRTVYVLPVEAGLGTQFGDGLKTVKALGVQTTENAIFVEPTFSATPWYADNATNPQIRQETYFVSVVVPFIDQQYPVLAAPAGRLLMGFSKSGWGAFTLLLRNPGVFGRAVDWDTPLDMTSPNGAFDFSQILGTSQNFANYEVSALLKKDAPLLQNQPPRLFMFGYCYYAADLKATDQLMTQLGIPHVYLPGVHRAHDWTSGWVAEAVNLLLS